MKTNIKNFVLLGLLLTALSSGVVLGMNEEKEFFKKGIDGFGIIEVVKNGKKTLSPIALQQQYELLDIIADKTLETNAKITTIQKLIDHGSPLHAFQANMKNSVSHGIKHDASPKLIQFLIDNGALIGLNESDYLTCLEQSAEKNPEIFQLLLPHKSTYNKSLDFGLQYHYKNSDCVQTIFTYKTSEENIENMHTCIKLFIKNEINTVESTRTLTNIQKLTFLIALKEMFIFQGEEEFEKIQFGTMPISINPFDIQYLPEILAPINKAIIEILNNEAKKTVDNTDTVVNVYTILLRFLGTIAETFYAESSLYKQDKQLLDHKIFNWDSPYFKISPGHLWDLLAIPKSLDSTSSYRKTLASWISKIDLKNIEDPLERLPEDSRKISKSDSHLLTTDAYMRAINSKHSHLFDHVLSELFYKDHEKRDIFYRDFIYYRPGFHNIGNSTRKNLNYILQDKDIELAQNIIAQDFSKNLADLDRLKVKDISSHELQKLIGVGYLTQLHKISVEKNRMRLLTKLPEKKSARIEIDLVQEHNQIGYECANLILAFAGSDFKFGINHSTASPLVDFYLKYSMKYLNGSLNITKK